MNLPRVRFSQHAMLKFRVLREHGMSLNQRMVVEIINHPSRVFPGYQGRKVAQGPLDKRRVLRVVYTETPEEIVVITFYPGKRGRYEQDKV